MSSARKDKEVESSVPQVSQLGDGAMVPTYLVALPPPAEREALGLVGYLRAVLRHKWLVAAITVVVTGLVTAFAFLVTPKYKVDVLLSYVANQSQTSSSLTSALSGQLSSLLPVGSLGINTDSSREEAVALLTAREFIGQFISDEALIPVLFADKWDAARSAWKVEGDDIPTLWDAVKLFRDKIWTVSDDSGTGLITASLEWPDATLAARWTGLLVARANASLRTRANDEAQKSIDYLNAEIQKTSLVNAQQAVYGLIEAQINRQMLANVQDEYAFKVLDPPVVPDADAFTFPNRKLFVAGGLCAGLFLGVFGALLVDFMRNARAAEVPLRGIRGIGRELSEGG